MDVPERRRSEAVHRGERRQVRRRPLLRPAWCDAALHHPGAGVRPGGGARLRRLLHPRLPGDPRVRHGAARRHHDRAPGPVPQGQDAQHQLLHPRPDHGRGLQPRPAQRGEEGRGVPRLHRHRRHRVLRPRGRVLRVRQRALRDHRERELLPHRLRGLRLEHGLRGEQPWLQGPLQGWLLPRSPGRPLRRPARRDLPRAGRPGPPGRASAPRGRHRRPGRDQLQVQHAAGRGRRPDALQVRREERRLAQRQDRDLHAEADLR